VDNRVSLIAICGRQGSGKTTAAKHLEKVGYTRIRFADRLKKMLREGLGIPDEYIDGYKKNESCEWLCGRTARHAMVTLGTEWGRRKIHKDIWVMALYRDMKHLINYCGYRKFVIDDLRFLSEEKWLRSLKYSSDIPITVTIIKLEREGVIISDHQSEREVDKINEDWIIYNNNSIESLEQSIIDTIKRSTTKNNQLKGGN
jgi:energy-coupling factor transporter ATP-binding protein EcfA2